MKTNKVLSMLGLAKRAGQIKSGTFLAEKAVKTGYACLVIIANDASDRTKKQFHNICETYEVPCVIYGMMADTGHALGAGDRSAVAVTDMNFATQIEKLISEELD